MRKDMKTQSEKHLSTSEKSSPNDDLSEKPSKYCNEHTLLCAIKEWERLSTEHGKTSSEAGAYYDKYILPHVEEMFVEKSKDLLEQKQYDGLILTVGGSPEPQILALCAIAEKSTQVGLLYREAAGNSFDRICKRMGWTHHEANSRARIISGSDTIEIYKTIMDFYTKWGKPKKIAVGITGGKKVMSGAAAMAGAILGADLYYIDTDVKNKFNKPVPGSEYLRLLDNPYAVFGDFEADKAKALFSRHDYAGARRIFEELRQQVRDLSKSMIYQIYGYLCEAYDAWDNFNVQHADKKLGELLDLLAQLGRSTELSDLYKSKSHLEEQKNILDRLRSFVNNKKNAKGLPRDKFDRFHFAFTLYHSALRRVEQGKYDLGCLLLYRLLEWIGQCRLDKYNIDTDASSHNYSGCGIEKEEQEICHAYIKKHKEVVNSDSEAKSALPTGRITLVDMYLLLHALGDDIVNDLNWGEFFQRIETRNRSIYIHGRIVVDESGFKKFHKTVKSLFKKTQDLSDINTSDFDKLNDTHQFIVLPK